MLIQLDIENIAVIQQASIEFETGFNVVTGETGAGKSLLINSLNMVLGCRASRELIRGDAPYARVCATFFYKNAAELLSDMGIESDDGSIVITRKLFSDGRNLCHINGSAVSVAQLRSVGEKLVVIYGQRDGGILLSTSSHLDFLDSFAKNKELLDEYKKTFEEFKEAEKELKKTSLDDKARTDEADYLLYALNEINSASLYSGEEEELAHRRTILENSESLSTLSSSSSQNLNGEGRVRDILYGIMQELEKLSRIDDACNPLYERASSLYYEAEDLGSELLNYSMKTQFNPDELRKTEERIFEINSLKRKYNKSVDALLEYASEAEKRLNFLNSYTENKALLESRVKELYEAALKKARELSSLRKKAAQTLSSKLTEELSELDMPKCRVEFSFTPCPISERGIEDAELLLSTNPSEEPKPLSKIASGGEMSRIMLALKSVFFDFEHIPTLLFDEIDTGVSGRAAEKISKKMRNLSSECQLICVTHLPIIAASGNFHILIEKQTAGQSFNTVIKPLTKEEREKEIARIIMGDGVNEIALENARQLLNQNSERKD